MPLALVIMAKYPTPGRVKTRLSPQLDDDQCADLHRTFLLHLLDRLGSLDATAILCFDPPERASDFAELAGDRVQLVAQSPGDLGERLTQAAASLADEYARVLFVGVDIPDLPMTHLTQMLQLTHAHDAAIAPTTDGGFWSLGVRTDLNLAPVLSGIDWSSGLEYDQTLSRLKAHVADVGIGARWSDIDRFDDLIALYERLTGSHEPDDRLLLAQLKELCPVMARDGVIA